MNTRTAILWILLMMLTFSVFLYSLDALIVYRLHHASSLPTISEAQEQWA